MMQEKSGEKNNVKMLFTTNHYFYHDWILTIPDAIAEGIPTYFFGEYHSVIFRNPTIYSTLLPLLSNDFSDTIVVTECKEIASLCKHTSPDCRVILEDQNNPFLILITTCLFFHSLKFEKDDISHPDLQALLKTWLNLSFTQGLEMFLERERIKDYSAYANMIIITLTDFFKTIPIPLKSDFIELIYKAITGNFSDSQMLINYILAYRDKELWKSLDKEIAKKTPKAIFIFMGLDHRESHLSIIRQHLNLSLAGTGTIDDKWAKQFMFRYSPDLPYRSKEDEDKSSSSDKKEFQALPTHPKIPCQKMNTINKILDRISGSEISLSLGIILEIIETRDDDYYKIINKNPFYRVKKLLCCQFKEEMSLIIANSKLKSAEKKASLEYLYCYTKTSRLFPLNPINLKNINCIDRIAFTTELPSHIATIVDGYVGFFNHSKSSKPPGLQAHYKEGIKDITRPKLL